MKLLLDMVHHNPGEPPFQSRFLDPSHLADYGFNGQVFKHLNCVITYAATGVDVFPQGSPDREWLDAFTPGIVREIAAAKAQGLKVFYHLDLFVLPKRLVGQFRDEICDPQTGRILLDRPRTLELHRVMFDEIAARFPGVDGFIIRVGETYLMDTPFHTGNGPIPRIGEAWTPTYLYEETLGRKPAGEAVWTHAQVDAYVKLIGFLRHEICERHGRSLFFRTWDIFPDRLHARFDHYLEVTDRIEPHPLLAFSIKHTALDFWRRVKVNECLRQGRHPQIIEVQCQREYEGKGAYPNYVMDGVINGFEENAVKTGLKDLLEDPKILGVYSWSRGGGWYGPYIPHELWPDLNAYVLARFVHDPSLGEEEIFREYTQRKIGLAGDDIERFRRLCLLSARAILKGRHCDAFDRLLKESVLPTAAWMRDDRLGGRDQLAPVLAWLAANGRLDEALAEKAEAVDLWNEIVGLAGEIHWPAGDVGGFVKVSAEYGRLLFNIVHQGWRVLAAGIRGDQSGSYGEGGLADAVVRYEAYWDDYRKLASSPLCPSLYVGHYFSLPGLPPVAGLDESVRHYKNLISNL
jgi:hypothetical protein